MFKILSDEELIKLASVDATYPHGTDSTRVLEFSIRGIAKAEQENTFKQVIEWGNEPCPHRGLTVKFKWECIECRIKLQKEVEGG